MTNQEAAAKVDAVVSQGIYTADRAQLMAVAKMLRDNRPAKARELGRFYNGGALVNIIPADVWAYINGRLRRTVR
jgi:hypothetical protein